MHSAAAAGPAPAAALLLRAAAALRRGARGRAGGHGAELRGLRDGRCPGGTGWAPPRAGGGSAGPGPARGGEQAALANPYVALAASRPHPPRSLIAARSASSSDVELLAPSVKFLHRGAGEAERCVQGYLGPQLAAV